MRCTKIDLTGKRFGKWTVIKQSGSRVQTLWHCRCDCGKEKPSVLYGSLTTGHSTSCGCSRFKGSPKERADRKTMWQIYAGIKTRCYNPNSAAWKHYGARGIGVCTAWRRSFNTFRRDMGERPSDALTIDRKDNNGHYCPENCRWATKSEQASNKRNNQCREWQGQLRTLTDICRMQGVRFNSFRNKLIQDGFTVEQGIEYCRARNLTWIDRRKAS